MGGIFSEMEPSKTPEERRAAILKELEQAGEPLSASSLAKKFHVSRQVVVGDVALLRASNASIAATPRGYVLAREEHPGQTYTIACRHTNALLAEELYTVVDNGGALLDVIVEHAVYGQLCGKLHIFSRYDADEFLKRISRQGTSPLSSLTGGVHLHTLACPSKECYERICAALREKGILFEPD